MTDRFCVYKIQAPCDECGNSVILDGPLRRLDCVHCQSTLEYPEDFWKALLEDALEGYDGFGWDEGQNSQMFIGGRQVRVQYGRQMPKCPACRELLPLDQIGPAHDGPVFCGQCGKRTSSHPAPDWLRGLFPTAAQLYCAATEADPDGAQDLEIQDASKPVVMSCMQCGGALPITLETPRITTCKFCDTDLYLPDPLWRRLHPVKKRVPWYVRFSG